MNSVAFSPNGEFVVSGSSDGTARFWDVATGSNLLTIYILKDGEEWIAIGDDGYYDCSDSALDYIAWQAENGVFQSDEWNAQYRRPGLVARVLSPN